MYSETHIQYQEAVTDLHCTCGHRLLSPSMPLIERRKTWSAICLISLTHKLPYTLSIVLRSYVYITGFSYRINQVNQGLLNGFKVNAWVEPGGIVVWVTWKDCLHNIKVDPSCDDDARRLRLPISHHKTAGSFPTTTLSCPQSTVDWRTLRV